VSLATGVVVIDIEVPLDFDRAPLAELAQ